MWVRIPLETYIFILNFSLPPRSEQVNGAVANEIKHVHSLKVIVVLDPRYDLSYKALYISTCSIALRKIKNMNINKFYAFVLTHSYIVYTLLLIECDGIPADLFFLLDSSTSIQPEEFRKQTEFAKDVLRMFEYGQSKTRVGLATFSDKYQTAIHLDDFNNTAALMEEIDRVPYLGGDTNTGAALRQVTEEFKNMSRREVNIYF